MFICVGVSSIRSSVVDVVLATPFGIVGYSMRRFGFPPAPLLLGLVPGLVLCPFLEQNFRRSLMLSRGDLRVIIEPQISGAILATILLIVIFMIWSEVRRSRRAAKVKTN